MKIERETDGDYRRWSFQTHPLVEKTVVLVLGVLVGGGAGVATAGELARLLGR